MWTLLTQHLKIRQGNFRDVSCRYPELQRSLIFLHFPVFPKGTLRFLMKWSKNSLRKSVRKSYFEPHVFLRALLAQGWQLAQWEQDSIYIMLGHVMLWVLLGHLKACTALPPLWPIKLISRYPRFSVPQVPLSSFSHFFMKLVLFDILPRNFRIWIES